ncbi:MAG TPA: lactate utilization protein [Vicinamibacterales bacterium]|nr:lactate utilization protein [Vicinamibacterales bacterium]
MSDARSLILARVRDAQRTGKFPNATAPAIPQLEPPSQEAMLARFLAELDALGVEHHVDDSADAVRARIISIVYNRSVLGWNVDRLPYAVATALPGAANGESPRDVQARADVGVTGCDAVIAETGTLVMLSGAGKPRAASLLPPIHVAIVRRTEMFMTMGEYFTRRPATIATAACCTFITGPSRTADIELTLTVGVHGPRKVIVVVGP